MTADSGAASGGAGGGPVRHIPVLLSEVLEHLQPQPGEIVLDGTFGAGGYSLAVLECGADVVALDRDPAAINAGQVLVNAHGGRLRLVQARFSELADHAPEGGLDAIMLDIGVSSMQIDEAERGFSFQKDGPLDMRMSGSGPNAADVINIMKAADLTRIFGFLGEEKKAGRIARAIEKRRLVEPFSRTRDLANFIETVNPRRMRDKIHPATRVFQALRIFVNEELHELAAALFAAERVLKPGGRLVVVSFHSLEDRIVKRFFRSRFGRNGGGSRHLPISQSDPATFEPIGKTMVAASQEEMRINPRARSAKLRSGRRLDAEPLAADIAIFGLPQLPAIANMGG
ncbi:MAG: 16S rRNA (cytosine(1402)-N(4))-methyltransferase RsmH [Alphaproteobacteria bacterium]|nr:16S rRNA (cytosine(1402)-N(4))-methyltransferase RsmH [Alphaproteobacteria bacterium]